MPADPARAKSLFLAVSDLPDPADRAAYLDRECGGDADLRGRVEALLRANDAAPLPPPDAGETLTQAPTGLPPTAAHGDPTAHAGAVLAGKYKLVEPVGAGGMGSVWRARQSEPVRRFVAVKLIKAGMDSKQVLARFEAERQALALMDHPNIAKVLDGGLHDGRPYFVMELVKGMPITDYCDAHKLTPRQRLELFVPVCQAIQHAHQKGVIHRDVKPSNVLVALYDDTPVAKVIDFGVAKATGQQLSEKTIDTGFGGVVGTPEYMSPEQATFNNLDVDTRSDVYALGVLLYELLTGSPPFARKELEKRGLLEMLRVVREEDPPRPSTRLSTADALPTLSANRGTEPRKLTGLLRSELDWIVMRALEKDRTRRYETANGFAADVLRYLSGEPVQAHPPSAAYRLKKFVRRNRPQVVAAGLAMLALVAGVIGTTLGLVEAKRHQRLAEVARQTEAERAAGERLAKLDAEAKRADAERAQARAEAGEKLAAERLGQVEAEKKRADEEKQIARAVKDFLQNKLLAQASTKTQADALLQAGRLASEAKLNPTVRELLDRAAKELAPDTIEANFPNQPLVQAEILQCIGVTYHGVGEWAMAISFCKRSEELYQRHHGPDHPNTLAAMNNLAESYRAAGNPELALPLYQVVLEIRRARLGPDHPDTVHAMNNLGLGYGKAGQFDKALPLLEQTLELGKAKLGSDHLQTLHSMLNLAAAYWYAGKPHQAVPLFEQAYKQLKAKLGPDHPDTLLAMNNLASGYKDTSQHDKALPLFEQTLELLQAKLGPDHPDTLLAMNSLANVYKDVGRHDKALPLFERIFSLRKARLGPDHRDTLAGMNNLAVGYWSLRQLDKSVPLFEELLALDEKTLGRDHPDTVLARANLGVNYLDAGRTADAVPMLEEAYRGAERIPARRWVVGPLFDAYATAGKSVEAVDLLDRLLADLRGKLPKDSPQLAGELAHYGRVLLEMKLFPQAEPLLREALAVREQKEPDDWRTFNTYSMLGGSLLGQKKYAEAEPLLLRGYEGMKAREKAIPPQGSIRLPEATDRLVGLYTATGKAEEAQKWRAERGKYPGPVEKGPPPREVK